MVFPWETVLLLICVLSLASHPLSKHLYFIAKVLCFPDKLWILLLNICILSLKFRVLLPNICSMAKLCSHETLYMLQYHYSFAFFHKSIVSTINSVFYKVSHSLAKHLRSLSKNCTPPRNVAYSRKSIVFSKKVCALSQNILSQKYCVSRESLCSLTKALSFFPPTSLSQMFCECKFLTFF